MKNILILTTLALAILVMMVHSVTRDVLRVSEVGATITLCHAQGGYPQLNKMYSRVYDIKVDDIGCVFEE